MALVLLVCIVVQAAPLTAQQKTDSPHFVIAAGPTWNSLTGLQLRAEYYLNRERVLGLRFEAGGRWTPTQSVTFSYNIPDLGSYLGSAQEAGLHLGIATVLSPWPRAQVTPYVVVGVAAVQTWNTSQGFWRYPDGSGRSVPLHSSTVGGFSAIQSVGMRMRLGTHAIQVELQSDGVLHLRSRRLQTVTLGTTLRF